MQKATNEKIDDLKYLKTILTITIVTVIFPAVTLFALTG